MVYCRNEEGSQELGGSGVLRPSTLVQQSRATLEETSQTEATRPSTQVSCEVECRTEVSHGLEYGSCASEFLVGWSGYGVRKMYP